MRRERMIDNFMEMVKISSPSTKEGEFTDYLFEIFTQLGMEIHRDEGHQFYQGEGQVLIAKLRGNIEGKGITLAAHTDVVDPCKDIRPIIENNIIRSDGTTTLGGDDKAGIAAIIETLNVIKEEKITHEDIYVILTPCEEIGMLGAKNIIWEGIPDHMMPAKDIIVIDNAGKAGLIAHTAPSRYDFVITFIGKNAHAGIEPEKGINAIQIASKAIANMKIGRVNKLTTSNIGAIQSNFPSNVVPDICVIRGEIRSHSEDKILSMLEEYEKCCNDAVIEIGGNYKFERVCAFPCLKPIDNLKFAKDFAKVYEELGVSTELQVIGGGSDSNIFAQKGYNSIIIGVGMYDVHTTNETLHVEELEKTTKALIKYISRER